jgi:preprotein translocase subunit SecE
MATKEDIKHDETGGPTGAEPDESRAESSPGLSVGARAPAGSAEASADGPDHEGHEDEAKPGSGDAHRTDEDDQHDDDDRGAVSPQQLGTQRFVYAAYFAAAIGIAFVMSKTLDYAWFRLQTYKPAIGEPREEVVMPVSALIGGGAAVYYWFRTRARELAEEVATEMSKVTWPTRTEVTNGTVVVIVTTIVSTVFFALMDRFWGFVSNLVYGGT